MGIKSFVFKFDDVEVREREFSVIKAGKVLNVEPKAFRALAFLLRNPQRLISKEEILNAVWGDAAVTEGSLTRCIWHLRSVLGDDIRSPRYIETVATVGYRFISQVEVSEDKSANPERTGEQNGQAGRDSGETQSGKQKAGKRGKQLAWLSSGAAVLVAGLAAAIWYFHRPLPPPRISGYSQITHDGHRKSIAGTDGSRLYFNFMSPRSMAQVAISGGETASIPVAVPGASTSLLRVSPDGSGFLIESVDDGNYSGNWALWNVQILGGSYHRLGKGLSSTFSPGGNSTVYVTYEGDLWIVKRDGTGAHRIASVGSMAEEIAWSPDGGKIRFTQSDRLWEINSSGSDPHPLLPGWRPSATQCCGRWTPDGKLFFFLSAESSSRSSQIWAIDERRGLLRRPPADPVQMTNGPIRWDSLTPGKDGKELFAVGRIPRGELARFDLKTKQLQPFLGGISADSVSFSADGKFVAYVSYPEGILWRANRDGSNPVQLSDPPMHPGLPRWSHDGAQILFDDLSSSSPKGYIVSALGGAAPQRLLPEDDGAEYDPNWSPDGHKIVFESAIRIDREGSSLSILDMTTGRVEKVSGSTGKWSPRWSPDGRYLVTMSWGSPSSLWLFDIQAQHWSPLPYRGIVDYPEWSSDSRFIYFLHQEGDDRGVFRVRAKDGAAERVVDLRNVHVTGGAFDFWFGLDPADSPLILRDISGDDIYALTLEEK
ncbi:MAG: winged helix-turn-helix domain-containing protein [Terracidiphilus sp.]